MSCTLYEVSYPLSVLSEVEEQSGGAGGQSTYEGLLALDRAWGALREGRIPAARRIVEEEPGAPAESARGPRGVATRERAGSRQIQLRYANVPSGNAAASAEPPFQIWPRRPS